MAITQDMPGCANYDLDFMKTIITGGKIWVYGYGQETKFQSYQIFITKVQKCTTGSQQCEGSVNRFPWLHAVVCHEYASQDQMVNEEYFLDSVWVARNW